MARRRIGVLTGGGDCPGLNAAIRAVAKAAIQDHDMEVVGFRDGFRGLVFDDAIELDWSAVSGILQTGGTILGTSNRDNLFAIRRGRSQLVEPGEDRTAEARRVFEARGLEGLVAIGGDGTLTVARHLHERGIPIVGVPKTIDNDVRSTDRTIGFDTARAVAADAVDRLHTTAASHRRVMVLEVMGRDAGWIALHAGLAGGGDVIVIPEFPHSIEAVCGALRARAERGRRCSIVVAAEGAAAGELLARAIEERTGMESRATVLGHLQRGGMPTAGDRVLATWFGHSAARLAGKGQWGRAVALRGAEVESLPLADVGGGEPRRVPRDHPLVAAARAVGTSFGEG
jgi:6-phosphofructokinase